MLPAQVLPSDTTQVAEEAVPVTMMRDNFFVSWSCWDSFHRCYPDIEFEQYWEVKCRAYDAMNNRTKAFWKSFSPSALVTRRAERNSHWIARGDIEPPPTLIDLKPKPKDDDGLLPHQPQLCYRRGPSSQLVQHTEGEGALQASPSASSSYVGSSLNPTMPFHASQGIAFQFGFSRWYKDFVDPDIDEFAK